ncbi:MAG: hypothetical protein ACXAD7_24390 [Candidatus Kariarchaeaceae archaeon]|jgi:hypothetical protein
MNEPTKVIELENQTIEIYHDDDPVDPREWDNLGTMAFFHKRYSLGDKHDFMGDKLPGALKAGMFPFYDDTPDDFLKYLDDHKTIELPVSMYDHSGIALSTNRYGVFADPWDSGMLGYIYVTYEKVRSEYGWKNLTQQRIQKIKDYLQAEVDVYNWYVQGRAYGYHLICNFCNEHIDSCWGFYGEDWKENGLMEYAEQDFKCVCQKAEVYQNAGMGL